MKIFLLQKRGLGNQLFQYAAGLYFAKKHAARLDIIRDSDEQAASFGHPRPFLLSNFSIETPFREVTLWDRLICSVAPSKKPVAALARLASGSAIYRQPCSEDRVFLPELPVSRSAKNVYIEGNFQAYQYAQTMEQRIRTEFHLREPASEKNLEVLEQIRAVETPVSLHVRRGDYAVWSGGPRVLSLGYYANAIQTVLQRVGRPTLFVFSDDMAFARDSLPKGERMVFVDHNDEANPHEDLRLMSACRHHIIANSSLSWWGAWLNPDPGKLVCAPMDWGLANSGERHPDMIPPGWLRIANETASI
ncbi:MAG: alpha-1,2-fucosyltransferase [Acidobacteriaceae bacterium]